MFQTHIERNDIHDQFHRILRRRNITTYHRDRSCDFCYPFEIPLTNRFRNFWNWYSIEYPAEGFSRYTQQYLEELFYTQGIEETWEAVYRLVFSVRYIRIPEDSYAVIRQIIYNVYINTQGFTLDPFTVLYIASETTSPVSQDDSLDQNQGQLINNLNPNNLIFNNEPLNLKELFREDNPMAAQAVDLQNLTAALQALQGVLQPPGPPNANNAIVNLQAQMQSHANALVNP